MKNYLLDVELQIGGDDPQLNHVCYVSDEQLTLSLDVHACFTATVNQNGAYQGQRVLSYKCEGGHYADFWGALSDDVKALIEDKALVFWEAQSKAA
jgi:hypothetical protein